MRRRSFLVGVAACGGALALGHDAAADEVGDALAEIARARASVKTLIGPFTQERTIGLLATAVKSEGEMTLVLPDRLRWELKPPDAITYWIGPEGFGYATAKGGGGSAGQGAAGRFGAVLSDLLILLGGDLEKLRGRYELSVPSRKDGIRPRGETQGPGGREAGEAPQDDRGAGTLERAARVLRGEELRQERDLLREGDTQLEGGSRADAVP